MKYIFRLGTLLICLAGNGRVMSQNLPVGSYYLLNWGLANPAAIDRLLMSSNDKHPTNQITTNLRNQWGKPKWKENPKTGFVQYEHTFDNTFHTNSYRLGGQLLYDQTDILDIYGPYINFTWETTLPNSKGAKIRFALTPGALIHQYDWAAIRARDDKTLDPSLMTIQDNPTRVNFDCGFGFFYHRNLGDRNVRYWGVSLPNRFMYNTEHDQGGLQRNVWLNNYYIVIGRYYDNWTHDSNNKFEYESTFWIKGVNKNEFTTLFKNYPLPFSINYTGRIYVCTDKNLPPKFWFGGGYGTNLQLTAELGYNLTGPNDHHTKILYNSQFSFAFNMPTKSSLFLLGPSFEVNWAHCWE